jgi:hypothetical protein
MATMPKMRVEVVFNTEHIEQRVARALASYRCQHTRDADGDALDLVDMLTPPGAADIADGKSELGLLAEHITMTVVDEVWAGEDDNVRGDSLPPQEETDGQ